MHFIVVGASVAGLATGLTLARAGHSVTIVEADSQDDCENRPLIGGAGLLPNATRLLLAYPGGKEHLEKHGTKINEVRFCDIDTNGTKGRIVFDPQIIQDLGAAYYLIPHHALTSFLRTQCRNFGGKIRYDFPVKKIETSRVEAAVVEGANGERLECDIIIGADGITSTVREFMLNQAAETQPCDDEDEDDDSDDDDGSSTFSASHLPGQYFPEVVGGVSMIPVEKLEADPELRHLLDTKSMDAYTGPGFCLIMGKHGPYYMFDLVCPRRARPGEKNMPWRKSVPAKEFFAPYIPKDNKMLQRLLALTDNAQVIVQSITPMPSFIDRNSRIILVGTAAHCVPVLDTHSTSLPLEDSFTLGRLIEKMPSLVSSSKLVLQGTTTEAEVRRAEVATLLRGYNEVRAPRSLQLAEADMKALGLTALFPGPIKDVFSKILEASLTAIPGEGILDQDEVGSMWADWVFQANYDALDAVDEWWLLYGKFAAA
ncbi:FAD/NAD(P)-binding domain-containing protein [Cylindrobasidium torrendii FP15055 ss-10]|uniref:FAD/NAD(P)-binding domain-containing protein n=1 Tax=Cylindrobasidium torrendii FP15055 ss-10 TaxID=1314674 RepID=A0A0D7BDP3_9AGAR|nr:FAD/NAD(P)-binding domain-containing protein [Cylindrobasidium torrendii FP15055 ss-10]